MIVGDEVDRVPNVNLMATGLTQILEIQPPLTPGELFFLPLFLLVTLRTLTGPALTVSPKFRVGANGTHDNISPIFTVPLGVQLNTPGLIPLVSFPFIPVDMRAAAIMFEVTQAGVGPTACACDVTVLGMKVSGQ